MATKRRKKSPFTSFSGSRHFTWASRRPWSTQPLRYSPSWPMSLWSMVSSNYSGWPCICLRLLSGWYCRPQPPSSNILVILSLINPGYTLSEAFLVFPRSNCCQKHLSYIIQLAVAVWNLSLSLLILISHFQWECLAFSFFNVTKKQQKQKTKTEAKQSKQLIPDQSAETLPTKTGVGSGDMQ